MTGIESRLLDLLKDLILVQSTEDNPAGLVHAVRLVRNHIDDVAGIRIEEHESGSRPSFVARPDTEEPVDLMLVGHVDVVEAGPDMFRPRVEGNRLYGRGSGDMKGQVAILTEVFREAVLSRPGVPIGLMITSDEESGGSNGVGYLVNDRGYTCKTAILPDSGGPTEVVSVEKGILGGRVVAGGEAGHSARPWLWDNAVHRLMENLARLVGRFEAFQGGGPGWHPTFSANVIRTLNHTFNRIPDRAEALVDIRFTEKETAEEMIGMVSGLLDERTEFHTEYVSEPLVTSPDPLFISVAERVTGLPVRLIRDHGGSDGRFFTRRGIPVIISRPNVGGIHSDREWIEIGSMVEYYRILKTYIDEKYPA